MRAAQIGGMFDGAFKQQAAFDLDALQRATGPRFGAAESERFIALQHQAMRWTYLGSGISHPNFLGTVRAVSPASAARLSEVAKALPPDETICSHRERRWSKRRGALCRCYWGFTPLARPLP
jgi:hypothetical protein